MQGPTERAVASVPAEQSRGEPGARGPLGIIVDAAAVLAAACVDGLLMAAALLGHVPIPSALLAHALLVALLFAWAVTPARKGRDRSVRLLAVLAMAVIGPLGAAGGLIAALAAPARRGTTRLLAAWYDRIAHSIAVDDVTRLCDNVAIGRTLDLLGAPPTSFIAVMERGNMADRQAALGLIARNFSVEYLPVLQVALRSPEPVIRVQAAAVAAHIQAPMRQVVSGIVTRAEQSGLEPAYAIAELARLETCLASGLVDEADRGAAVQARARLAALAGDLTTDARGLISLVAVVAADPVRSQADVGIERLLMAKRRFRDLRNWRRIKEAGRHRSYRLRTRAARGRRRAAETAVAP